MRQKEIEEPVIITGSSGYIGKRVVDELKRNRIENLGIDRIPGSSCTFELSNKEELQSIVDQYVPNTIMHFGTNSVGHYANHYLQSFEEDSLALTNLLRILQKKSEIRLIFFSSSYVYSGFNGKAPVDELAPLSPTNPFGAAKYFFEHLILNNHENSVIFRLTNVFGKGPQKNDTTLLNWISQGKSGEEITIWGRGKRFIQYIYIENVLKAILGSRSLNPGVWNLGGNSYRSIAEVAHLISANFGVEVRFLLDKQEGEMLPEIDTTKIREKIDAFGSDQLEAEIRDYLNKLSN